MNESKKMIKINKVKEYIAKNNAEKIQNHDLYYNSFEINPYLRPIGNANEKADLFFKKVILEACNHRITKLENKKRDFYIIIANLSLASKNRPLIVDLNKNFYNKNERIDSFIITIVKILEQKQLIYIKKGYYDNKIKSSSFKTRIWPSERLIQELFNSTLPEKFCISDISPAIILRDFNDKTEKKFKNNDFTRQLERRIKAINDCNSRFTITIDDNTGLTRKLNTDIRAIFNGSWENGGRFYTKGVDGYQQLRATDRAKIKINGNSIVELDYSFLHPCLLYAIVGQQLSHDPYESIMNKVSNIDEAERLHIRQFLKIAFLALVNTKSSVEMIRACNYELSKNNVLRDILSKYNITAKKIFEFFKKEHQPISQYFCTTQGLKLMRIDSQIALEIMMAFTEKKEACLCIHDSFIVECKNESFLEASMDAAYQKICSEVLPNNMPFKCQIKRS